jgi:hypothetical protein
MDPWTSCQEKSGVGTPGRGLPEIFDLSGPAGDGGLELPLGPSTGPGLIGRK